MNKFAKYGVITMIVAATGLTAVGASASGKDERGHCDRAEMRDRFAERDLNLTADEVRTLMEAKLIMRGEERLKVGQVAEKDADTYLVDIVTVDDSLVRQVEIDRDSGFPSGHKPFRK